MGSGVAAYFKALSPSKVNGFLDWRSKWFLTDVLKRKLPGSPDLHRGTAVENGIVSVLTDLMSLEDGQALAVQRFKEYTADLDVDECAECEAPIPDLVKVGVETLKPYGKIVNVQRKVWGEIPGTVLDWIGYADIEFEGGIIVDLKVTGRTPSEMSFGHCRQGAFYQKFIPDCQRVDFIYLIPLKKETKAKIITIKDVDKHINDLKSGAIAMNALLSISDDPKDLIPFFHPAPGDWWLKDELASNAASEIWGISHFEPAKES